MRETDNSCRPGGPGSRDATPELSVVVPIYNEEANIEQLYRRLAATLGEAGISFELILVDDGSADRSLAIVKRLASGDERVRYASFSRNFGHEAASTCGMRMVRGRAAVLMDADLQDPPEVIPLLHARWREGYDVVCARRSSRAGESFMKKATSHYFYRFMNRFSNVKLPVDVGDFRLADRKVVEAFNRLPEHSRFVRGLFCWVGYRQTEVEYERHSRAEGKTKYNWVRLLLLSLDAFFGFSLVPLRLCILLGVIVIAFSFVIACIIIAQRLFFSLAIPGYALMTTGMFFLGGVQLTFLGVIGEYVGKIFTQVQGRPLYIVNETSGPD